MLLADCVNIFSGDSSKLPQAEKKIRQDLVAYVSSIGEVCEVRAVAYHDLAQIAATSSSASA